MIQMIWIVQDGKMGKMGNKAAQNRIFEFIFMDLRTETQRQIQYLNL